MLCISEVRYDHVSRITPLMSALPIWESLKEGSDSDLHAKIKTLLIVQVFIIEWLMFHIVEFEWDSVLTILFSFCVQVCRCVCEERTFKVGKWNPAVVGKRDRVTSGAYLFTRYSLMCFFIQCSKLTSFLCLSLS